MCQFSNKNTDEIVLGVALLPIFPGPGEKEYLETLVPWLTTFLFPLTAFSPNVQGLKHNHIYTPTHKADLHPHLSR